MSLSWWMWVGVVVVVVAMLRGVHWAVLDLLMDGLGRRRADEWREREPEASGTAAMPDR